MTEFDQVKVLKATGVTEVAGVSSPHNQSLLENRNFMYVGFWARVFAAFIDSIVFGIVFALIAYFIFGQEILLHYLPGNDTWHEVQASPIGVLSSDWYKEYDVFEFIAYTAVVLFFWMRFGATPGKMIIGAQVVDATTGRKLSLRQSIVRYMGYFVCVITFFIGFIVIAFDAKKRGFHDRLAGSVVVAFT